MFLVWTVEFCFKEMVKILKWTLFWSNHAMIYYKKWQWQRVDSRWATTGRAHRRSRLLIISIV